MAQNETRRGTRVAPTATPVTAPGGGVVVKGVGQTVQAMIRTNDLRGGGGRNLTQMASSAVVRTAPKVYSPLYEMSNLMLPRDLRTMNAWCRHFYNVNPIVRNAINLHATYPISKFEITCRDPKVKNFFIDQADHIDLMGVLLSMSLEFWKHGEAFPYSELDENKGWWDYVFMHNPDYIRVKTNVLTREPIITLVPDDALRRLAQTQNAADRALREQLPQDILYHLKRGEDIPLPNFNVAHLKMLSSDYDIRGTSLIVSVFKDLMLYDKIREAKLAQADNFINPITLVKLGDPAGAWKPNDQDIVNFRNAWMESTYDPDAKLITHGAVTVEKVSNAGQTLDMASDLELIIKNLYAGLMMPEAIMNGEGATYNCHDVQTEVLTDEGYKTVEDIVEFDDSIKEGNQFKKFKRKNIKIACFNPTSEELEYHSPEAAQVFDYNGEMVKFQTNKIDLLVTPNHNMWTNCRKTNSGWHSDWKFERADLVKGRIRRFRSVVNWKGIEPSSKVKVAGQDIGIEDFLKFVGYFIAEGSTGIYGEETGGIKKNKYYKYYTSIAQSEVRKDSNIVSSSFLTMKELIDRLPFKFCESYDIENNQQAFIAYNKDLSIFMREKFGHYSWEKHLPSELKNLTPKYLRILLDALCLGDGNLKVSIKNSIKYYSYITTSKVLADDMSEIALKLGYAPINSNRGESRIGRPIYVIYWSDSEIGRFPVLDTRSKELPQVAITRENYEGKVFCFTVPHHLFIVRRNGKVSIQGNSASIGLEVLRSRYERFRNLITRWVTKKVFEPISKIQDFYEYKDGEKKLIVPEVQWSKINLKDTDSYWTAVSSLMSDEPGKSRVSKRTAFGVLDIDPDSEEQSLKEETVNDLIRSKEIERLSKMTVEELKTLDLTKPIPDMHPDQAAGGEGAEGAEGAEGSEGDLGDLGGSEGGGSEPSGLGGGFDLGGLGGNEEGGGKAGGEPAPAAPAPAAPAGGGE